MRRIKGLMPSLKEKKRYMRIEVIPLDKGCVFTGRPLQELVSKINGVLGFFDAAGTGILPVDFKNGEALIRVSAKYLDRVRASLLFINELASCNVILKTIKVSGSVNKARTASRR